jgi:hypothetical protein
MVAHLADLMAEQKVEKTELQKVEKRAEKSAELMVEC